MSSASSDSRAKAVDGSRKLGHFQVRVWRDQAGARIPVAALKRALMQVGRTEKCRGSVHVIIASETTMHDLNRRFRRRDRPTDVLAFSYQDCRSGVDTDPLVGEIYCNYDHARRWREEHGGTIADELVRLAVHGCLHLCGYDHHTEAQRRRMAAAENRYLAEVGLIALRQTRPGRRPYSERPSRRRGDM